ncbi:hypothetical protein Lser_V15G11744 [Lactuca serriola]
MLKFADYLLGVGVKLVGNTVWSTLFHQFLIVMSLIILLRGCLLGCFFQCH